MSSLPRRRLLSSIGSLSLAGGLAGCSTNANQCGEEPILESRNVETDAVGTVSALGDANWPQPGYDGRNLRYNPNATGLEAPVRVVWSQSFGRDATTVPVVADGTVYISDESNRLTAIDARTGSIAWRFDDVPAVAPVLAGDGVVFVANGDGLHAVETGSRELRWTFGPTERDETTETDLHQDDVTTPVLTETTVYVGFGNSRRVHAIDCDTGAERWQIAGEQAAGASGDAVFVYDAGSVMAVEADDGTARWTEPIPTNRTVAISNGSVYGTTDASTVAAFDANTGEKRWEFERTHELLAPPSVSPDGVFVGTGPTEGADGGNLYALNPDSGDIRWCEHFGFERVRPPAITDETVYVPRSDGLLQARASDDGTLRWQFHEEHLDFGTVAALDQLMVTGTEDGRLYAFAPA